MSMNRRKFLFLTTGASAFGPALKSAAAAGKERVIDAGPVSKYAAEGVYPGFRDLGFFVVRKQGKLFALSSICPHRACKLKPERDHSFSCPCHGSTFAPGGKVLTGPASRDMPTLASAVNEKGRMVVKVPA